MKEIEWERYGTRGRVRGGKSWRWERGEGDGQGLNQEIGWGRGVRYARGRARVR